MKTHYRASSETAYKDDATGKLVVVPEILAPQCDYYHDRKSWHPEKFAYTIDFDKVTCKHCLKSLVFDRSFTTEARDKAWHNYCVETGRAFSVRPKGRMPKFAKIKP